MVKYVSPDTPRIFDNLPFCLPFEIYLFSPPGKFLGLSSKLVYEGTFTVLPFLLSWFWKFYFGPFPFFLRPTPQT